jgi:uncharacterized OB-fold protein
MPVSAIVRDDVSAEFFDGTARGELLLRKCPKCGHINAPHIEACIRCGSPELGWQAAGGTGRVETFAVVHLRGDPPSRLVVAKIGLAEGPWIDAQIVDVDPDRVQIGDEVTLDFERPEGGEAVPVFRMADRG